MGSWWKGFFAGFRSCRHQLHTAMVVCLSVSNFVKIFPTKFDIKLPTIPVSGLILKWQKLFWYLTMIWQNWKLVCLLSSELYSTQNTTFFLANDIELHSIICWKLNSLIIILAYCYLGPDHLESIILKIIGKKSIILLVIYNLLFQKIIDFLPIIQANYRQKINYFWK